MLLSSSGFLDFISIDFWHIIMAMGNLLILTFIIRKFLFKPVNDILKKRQEEVDRIYSDADKAKQKAEEDKELYAHKINNAVQEADSIIKSATKRANERSDEIIEDANKKAEELLEKADSDIDLKKKKAASDMKNDISGIIIDLAERVVEKEISPQKHNELIESAIEKLGDV